MQPVPTGPGGVPLADYGQRVGAALLDGLIVGVGFFILYFILGAIATVVAEGSEGGAIATFLVGLIALGVAYLLYAPMLMKRSGENNGQTVGKQVLDIRVVREDGQPMDFGKGAFRDVLVRIVASWLTCGLFGILDILWPLWDDERRALHDMAAKTRVVRA